MTKVLYILILFVIGSFNVLSQSYCDADVLFYIQESSPSDFTISLKANEALPKCQIELYDLYDEKVIQKKQLNLNITKEEVFKNVKPSLYLIYIRRDGCDKVKSLGGIQGIKVGRA